MLCDDVILLRIALKLATVILAGTETHEGLGRLVNALEAAKELKEAGDDLRVVFDGAGTEGLATLSDPGHRAHALLAAVRDQVRGACPFCARAFHVEERLLEAGAPFLSEYDDHPSIRQLLVDGYQVLTF
jgi:hypothetical protein